MKIPVSGNYFRLRLESHPDYPSLLAVKDTLDELNISCNTYQTDKAHLQQLAKPFLLHLIIGEGQIKYFPNIETANKKVKEFDKYWDGIAMLADITGKTGNSEHDRQYSNEKRYRLFGYVAAILSFIILSIVTLSQYSLPVTLLLITNISGLYLSLLIAQKELGISNSISEKICSFAAHSRCEAVLFSKGARLFNWLTWGDVGIIYFITSLIFLTISQLSIVSLQFYHWISLSGLLFLVYSLYYQWKIVKQWCMLCIGVLTVLLLNAVISIINLPVTGLNNHFLSLAIFLTAAIIVCCCWQITKVLLQKNIQALSDKINYARMKRNPDVFNGLLNKEEFNSINLPYPDEAIRFGKQDAPLQIVMACNPYCVPCAKAHQAIEKLYTKYRNKVALNIRFAINNLEETNPRVKAAITILKTVVENKATPDNIIKTWYEKMNYESFTQKYNPDGAAVTYILEEHKKWSKDVNITGTPTLFINGKRLPEEYSWKEFVEIIEFEIQN